MDSTIPKIRHAHASTIRSKLMLEVAAEMVLGQPNRYTQIKISPQVDDGTLPIHLTAASTTQGIEDVVAGRASTGIANPATMLSLAYRGRGPFKTPQPVRAIAVIPSLDHCMMAVTRESGLTYFEDIPAKRYPLRIAAREIVDHCMFNVLDDVMAACGFSMDDVRSWGGDLRHVLHSRSERLAFVGPDAANAIYDEAVHNWIDDAVGAGMTILTFQESTLRKLQALGYRPGVLRKSMYPCLPHDIVTLDFSGWTIYVRDDAPDWLVTRFCAGLEARKHAIPWQEPGPLPVERMCREGEDTPCDVPLHPAAEAFWRKQGYIP